MPRITASNNDSYDFCRQCYRKRKDKTMYQEMGDGPYGRGNCYEVNSEHPHYESNGYRCDGCYARLTEYDE